MWQVWCIHHYIHIVSLTFPFGSKRHWSQHHGILRKALILEESLWFITYRCSYEIKLPKITVLYILPIDKLVSPNQ